MTKREEVRLACLAKAIDYFKAVGIVPNPEMVVAAAKEFEVFVHARNDNPMRRAS